MYIHLYIHLGELKHVTSQTKEDADDRRVGKKEVPPATIAALQRRGFACASTQPRLVSAATRFSSVESGVRAVD